MKNNLSFAGENDFLKPHGTELVESCVEPLVIHHPKGHTIPRFGNSLAIRYSNFLTLFAVLFI